MNDATVRQISVEPFPKMARKRAIRRIADRNGVPASTYLRTIIIDVIAKKRISKKTPMIAAQQAKL